MFQKKKCEDIIDYSEVVNTEKYITKDNCIYWDGRLIKDIDSNTFEDLGYRYAKDKNNVYHWGKKMSVGYWLINENIQEVDVETFVVMSDYAKDKNNVYYSSDIFIKANPETFEVVGESRGFFYSKDFQNVYINKTIIKNADPLTFELLSEFYSKDKENSYFREVGLEGSDPDTLEVVGHEEARDKNNHYYRERIVKNDVVFDKQ